MDNKLLENIKRLRVLRTLGLLDSEEAQKLREENTQIIRKLKSREN